MCPLAELLLAAATTTDQDTGHGQTMSRGKKTTPPAATMPTKGIATYCPISPRVSLNATTHHKICCDSIDECSDGLITQLRKSDILSHGNPLGGFPNKAGNVK